MVGAVCAKILTSLQVAIRSNAGRAASCKQQTKLHGFTKDASRDISKSIAFTRASSTDTTTSAPGIRQEDRRDYSWSARTEWKIFGTVAAVVVSWYINARQDRKQSRVEIQLSLVTNQLKDLYGPLYGNRIVAEASYRAAMKEHGGLRKYLTKAQVTRDAEMIKVWRAFVINVLYPLDKQVLDLLANHSHLIADSEFPEEFDTFLEHMARMQLVIEHWKNDKGKLESVEQYNDHDFLEETNSTGIGGSKAIIRHLREKCQSLRERQMRYTEELSAESLNVLLANKILK